MEIATEKTIHHGLLGFVRIAPCGVMVRWPIDGLEIVNRTARSLSFKQGLHHTRSDPFNSSDS
jgi:hypothetical protein